MKKNILLISLFWCFYSFNLFAQDDTEYTYTQLMIDIHNRNFDKPIIEMNDYLKKAESNISNFNDSTYIGVSILLATTFVQNNQINKADSIISHAMTFLKDNSITSKLVWGLYFMRGGLYYQLEDYIKASICYKIVTDWLKENNENNVNDVNIAVALSALAATHLETEQHSISVNEIDEALSILANNKSSFSQSNIIQLYQKAGSVYYKNKNDENAIKFSEMAYNLSIDKDEFQSEFINIANSLSVIYIDKERYTDALNIYKKLETLNLSIKERISMYEGLYVCHYFLGNKGECVKYAELCSQLRKENALQNYSFFPKTVQENSLEKNVLGLKNTWAILDKFICDSSIVMSYNNSLFLKNLSFNYLAWLNKLSEKNETLKIKINQIKEIRETLLSLDTDSEEIYKTRMLLEVKEKELLEFLHSKYNFELEHHSYEDVKRSLKKDEIAIELITYSGFWSPNEKEKILKYGAIIVSRSIEKPIFVSLCTFNELSKIIYEALLGREFGLNNLYLKNNLTLYELIWEKIEPYVRDSKKIYYSPILGLQSINLGFIPCPDGKYLNDKYDIHTVTSTAQLCQREDINLKDAVAFGGISFDGKTTNNNSSTFRSLIYNELSDSTRGNMSYLPASLNEVDSIEKVVQNKNYVITCYTGTDATEQRFRELDENSPSIIHLATHAFYLVGSKNLVEYLKQLNPYSYSDLSMLQSGFVLANANNTINKNVESPILNDGVLTAEEISMLDLSKTQLVVLSSCYGALGNSLQEGIGGLVKAFKMAGVKQIIASLWEASDDASSLLMTRFYSHLVSGCDTYDAIIKAQRDVAKLYPDPYYWAGFVLIK